MLCVKYTYWHYLLLMHNQAGLFQLDDDVTYLNGAYMSPMLTSVAAIGKKQVEAKLRPYSITGNDFFRDVSELKQAFGTLINAPANRIALVPSVSYGMANVAKNVALKGKEILVLEEQFPSNVYPWLELEESQGAKVVTVSAPTALYERGKNWNNLILESITSHTGLVAMPHTHWADGTLFDLVAIRAKTREVGALLIIDGTQSVGAHPFDVTTIEPDALVCAGYKWLMGPYGLGVAYYGSAFDNGQPVEQNWINRFESENFAALVDYNLEYQPGAMRYSVGEQSNFILVPMLLQALHQLNQWGVEAIQQYCKQITTQPLETLRSAGFWVEEQAYRTAHLFGIRKAGLAMNVLKSELEKHRIFVSVRGSSIRVSPHVYNTGADVEKLVDVLTKSL